MKTRIEAFFLWIYFFFGDHRKQWYDQMEIYHYAYYKQVEELDKLVKYTDGEVLAVRKAYRCVIELVGTYKLLMTYLSEYPNSYTIAVQIIEYTKEAERVEKIYNDRLLSIDIK